jgi:formate--tetrahydrofolate ligase
MNPDFLINQEATLEPISVIAYDLGLTGKQNVCELYGKHIAKVDASKLNDLPRKAKLVLVTAINPTPAGEGKTTTTIGLSDALCAMGEKSIVCLREPALGPVFGMKGGATGGGYSQVAPMEKINLHFTGDFHAIAAAHNLLAAMVDNHIHQGNELGIDKVTWRRVIDMNDRALRDGFDIVVASEVMAILCLSTSPGDLRDRLARIVIGYNKEKEVTSGDLQATGAMAALLVEAIKPNLVQTLEGNPALIHGGPFANIAHGCNSVIATDLGLKISDWVITEAGFGSDLGAEKFLDIKARSMGVQPDVVVIVATVRALKHHGDGNLELGFENLRRHITNITDNFNLRTVVCINKFKDDTQEDLDFIQHNAKAYADDCVVSEHWAKGSKGALDLANSVMCTASKADGKMTYAYDNSEHFIEKITKVARKVYGLKDVLFPLEVQVKLRDWTEKYGDFPICISKTHKTFEPVAGQNFVWITDVELRAGAGFIVVKLGNTITLPGLPETPSAVHIDVIDGKIIGLN